MSNLVYWIRMKLLPSRTLKLLKINQSLCCVHLETRYLQIILGLWATSYFLMLFFFCIQIYYVRLASDGTPDGNLNFSLTKGTDCKNLGMVVVNDDTNIVTILVLCKHGKNHRYYFKLFYSDSFTKSQLYSLWQGLMENWFDTLNKAVLCLLTA